MAILDTNALLRYLTEDNPEQAQRALAVLEQVEAGRLRLTLLEGVVVETVQVLSSRRLYDVPRETIRTRLSSIIRLPGIQMTNKRTYLRAFDLYVEYGRLSFIDALCVAYAQRQRDATVTSFDRDYRGIPEIAWSEP